MLIGLPSVSANSKNDCHIHPVFLSDSKRSEGIQINAKGVDSTGDESGRHEQRPMTWMPNILEKKKAQTTENYLQLVEYTNGWLSIRFTIIYSPIGNF